MSKRNEQTSKRIAAIAGRILNDGKFSWQEVRALAASALTQARDKATRKK